ncbi:hypothetical protein LguiB_017760 [Lonicera macranthoides]
MSRYLKCFNSSIESGNSAIPSLSKTRTRKHFKFANNLPSRSASRISVCNLGQIVFEISGISCKEEIKDRCTTLETSFII